MQGVAGRLPEVEKECRTGVQSLSLIPSMVFRSRRLRDTAGSSRRAPESPEAPALSPVRSWGGGFGSVLGCCLAPSMHSCCPVTWVSPTPLAPHLGSTKT